MNDEEKYIEEKFQIYSPHNAFIKGWYTIEELQEIIATMRRIKRANDGIAEGIKNDADSTTTIR